MAENLVGMMATKFEPDEYKDEYKQAVMELVEAKVEKREVIAAAEPETETTVVDLMAALKASVENAKKAEQAGARAKRGGHESLVHKKESTATKERRKKAS
jgi:DNA end-binding protein Ku